VHLIQLPTGKQLLGVDLNSLADEGSYFAAMTATPSTAYNLTGATQTAFVATTPTILIFNNELANSYKRYYLDTARICWVAAPTAPTAVHGCVIVDTGNRYSSGGTALVVANVNDDDSKSSLATVYGGAITAVAASANVRYLHRFTLSSAIPAAGETYELAFGEQSLMTSAQKGAAVGPVVIGPQQSALIYLWLPSQTATGTGELSLDWWER
jgi:hypothetical protein